MHNNMSCLSGYKRVVLEFDVAVDPEGSYVYDMRLLLCSPLWCPGSIHVKTVKLPFRNRVSSCSMREV